MGGKKGYSRLSRVAANIKREIPSLVVSKVSHPNIGIFTISDITLSKDYSRAILHISVLNESEIEDTLSGLNRSASYLRTLLAKKMDMRTTPALRFVYDQQLIKSNRIAKILDNLPTASSDEEDDNSKTS